MRRPSTSHDWTGPPAFDLNAYNTLVNYMMPRGYKSTAVVAGDVNNDGHQDMVVATSRRTGTVIVFLGNGNGTFQPAVMFGTGGRYAKAVAVGDMNEDGNLDIIAANYGENDVGGEGFNVIGTYSLSKRTSILAKYRDLTLAGSNERLTALGIHHAF